MAEHPDVTVVGGGIAGASLACALATAGMDVEVLEATERFTDRVRGESMMPWGVAEAEALGVAEVLRDAGAHVAPAWSRYTEAGGAPVEIPVGLLVPEVPGALNLHHPTACQALLDAAAAAGATVRRGVADVSVSGGRGTAEVAFVAGGRRRTSSPRLVVGADGRDSAVRESVGIQLERNEATAAVVGLLLSGVEEADDHDVVIEHALGMGLLFRQCDGRARAYHVVALDDRPRYAGAGGASRFVDDFLHGAPQLARQLRDARPAGPCASFPNVETWTDAPAAGSTVLIGDAAGQTDPTIGCGLSVAMRDARVVRDLVLAGATGAADFAGYGSARAALLARLRLIASVMVESVVRPGPDRSERRARFAAAMAAFDPQVFPLVLGMFAGPDTVPAEIADGGFPAGLLAA